MFCGMVLGYCFRKSRPAFVHSLITFLIWLLLYSLGLEVGANRELLAALPSLGLEALLITFAVVWQAPGCYGAASRTPPRKAGGMRLGRRAPQVGARSRGVLSSFPFSQPAALPVISPFSQGGLMDNNLTIFQFPIVLQY